MNAKKILVPVDFSQYGETALETAAVMLADPGGELIIVHAEDPVQPATPGDLTFGIMPIDLSGAREKLHATIPHGRKVPHAHRLLFGSPAEEIVRAAKEEAVDLIVMSTHGRTGLMHMLMGSVAEHVIRKSPCPVLILKPQPSLVINS